MADQVNPLGSLASGMAQAIQVQTTSPSKTPPKPVESKAPSLEKRSEGVPKESPEQAAKAVQDYLQNLPTDIKFVVDRDTGRQFFQIINPDTKEVILQVPSEEILAMSRHLRALSDSKNTPGILISKEG